MVFIRVSIYSSSTSSFSYISIKSPYTLPSIWNHILTNNYILPHAGNNGRPTWHSYNKHPRENISDIGDVSVGQSNCSGARQFYALLYASITGDMAVFPKSINLISVILQGSTSMWSMFIFP